MPKVSAKRQITLPASQCDALDIHPGDEVVSFVANGEITIIKKVTGAGKGLLSRVTGAAHISDEQSLQDAME